MLSQEVPCGQREYIVLLDQPRRQRPLPRPRLPKHEHPQHLALPLSIRPSTSVRYRRPSIVTQREGQRLLRGRGSAERTPLYKLCSSDLLEYFLRVMGQRGTARTESWDDGNRHEDGEDEGEEGGAEKPRPAHAKGGSQSFSVPQFTPTRPTEIVRWSDERRQLTA